MANGKPLFKTPEEVQIIADKYFAKYPTLENAKTDAERLKAEEYKSLGILPTISGLCLQLGFFTLKQFEDYANKRAFRSVFEGLRLRLLSYWESALGTGKGTQGVSNWIDYVTKREFLGKSADSQGVRGGSVAVVVIGSDGSRQTLSDILQAQNPPQIQSVKTIEAKAQEVKTKSPKRQAAAHQAARTKTLKKLANPHK